MLTLTCRSDEPFWLELAPGVRVKFRPVTVAMILSARRIAAEGYRPDEADAADLASVAFTCALARAAIVAWEGIGDAQGSPVEPSDETIDQLTAIPAVFLVMNERFVAPAIAGVAAAGRARGGLSP